ncbi:MAG: site-specific DNA-methyltransferase [Lamprobacter sp.]|uniref:DNA-methyltransferase n=1 Tax=Lamprobacter sp. TaxID=3100796 RepID=UPI002B26064A|nr:site-specific DNA-methyltransferase [Lamprobacter sp.]MEA3643337.1 site-specific DNA-methyltransferase [Lamprobacter sp.]
MTEKVVIGNAELYQGDCLEVMADIKPMSVDAVITDPPYMIGAISIGDKHTKAGGWADMENSAWWYAEWLKLARRALKQEGFACVFGNWRSLPTLLYAFSKIKWSVDSLMIWDKEWIGPAGPRQLRPTYEVVLFAGMPNAKIDDRSASDVYRCRWMAGHNKTTAHAAEKPVDLMRHLIRLTTKPGQVVLDCFMGSGTTGEAAHIEGRRFIGIEREHEYFHGIAVPRVQGSQAQQTLDLLSA